MFFEPNRVVLDPSTCFFDARIVLLEPSKVAVYSMLSMSVQREIRVETFLRPLVAHPLLAMSQAASSETFDTPIDGPISSSSIITIIHHPSSIIRRPSPVIRHPPSVIRHPLSLHHLPPSPLPNSPCVPPHPIHRAPSPSKTLATVSAAQAAETDLSGIVTAGQSSQSAFQRKRTLEMHFCIHVKVRFRLY